MKKIKTLLAFLMIFTMVLSLTACAGTGSDGTTDTAASNTDTADESTSAEDTADHSDILVENFKRGAEEAGHSVEVIDVCHADIRRKPISWEGVYKK